MMTGFPVPDQRPDERMFDRYQRQLALPGFDEEGQTAIGCTNVAVIGAGGLGSSLLTYLAGAGVGKLTIIDGDDVELVNLHRQVIHSPELIGVNKALSAREYLEILNPEVDLLCISENLTRINAAEILPECDMVCDCSDNFGTRYLIDETAEALHLPVVYGAVTGWYAQIAVFLHNQDPDQAENQSRKSLQKLRDIFPEEPKPGAVPKSREAGILGPVAGMIGCIMATEALKVMSGMGSKLSEKFVSLDTLSMEWHEIRI